MQFSPEVAKPGDCRVREMDSGDLDRVFMWRNSGHVRNAMLNAAQIPYDEHKSWFARVLVDPRSRYLVFEWHSRPVGLVYFTQIDDRDRTCRWGFYLGEQGLPKGMGTILCASGLNWIFRNTMVISVVAEVLASNSRSLGLHRKLGFAPVENPVPGTKPVRESIWFGLDLEKWKNMQGTVSQ